MTEYSTNAQTTVENNNNKQLNEALRDALLSTTSISNLSESIAAYRASNGYMTIPEILAAVGGGSVPEPPPNSAVHWWDFTDETSLTVGSGLIESVADKIGAINIAFASGERPALENTNVAYAKFRGAERGTFSSTLNIDRRAVTVVVFGNVWRNNDIGMLTGNSDFFAFYWRDLGTDHGLAHFDTGARNSTTVKLPYNSAPPNTQGVYGQRCQYHSGSASAAILGDGITEDSLAAPVAGTSTAAYFMAWINGTGQAIADVKGALFYDKALSTSELAEVTEWGRTKYGTPTAASKDTVIICAGDSLTDGFGPSAGAEELTSWPAQLSSQFNLAGARVVNVGQDGLSISDDTTAANVTNALTAFSDYTNRIVVVNLGSNDIFVGGDSAATVQGNWDTYIASILGHTTAPTKLYGSTIIDRGSDDADRATFNTHIKNDADLDGVIDLAAQSEFSDASDTTYYQVDEIHCTEAGYTAWAGYVRAGLIAGGDL